MYALIALYFIIISLALLVFVLYQHQTGRCDLFSIRNIAIFGFIIFQLTSASTALFTGNFGRQPLSHVVSTSLEYAFMVSLFLPIAFWTYSRGWIVIKLTNKLPLHNSEPGDYSLLAISVVATVIAAIFRMGVSIPLVFKLSDIVGVGLAAASCGLVGWVWGRRLLNPGLLIYMLIILATNAMIVMSGSFGRRGLVSLGAGMLWGMYYSSWRYLSLRSLMTRMAVLSIGPILFIAAFTSVRSSGQNRSASEHLQEIASVGKLSEGIILLMAGQECAPISMWLIETHPKEFEYRHMLSLVYFLTYPIPRDLWPGKPTPMSQMFPQLASYTRVSKKINVGPGVIGSAAAEGGLYAIIIYAFCSGLYLRFFDEIIRIRSHSPLIIVSIGSALGQIVGLARGETSSFAAITILTIFGTLAFMIFSSWILRQFGLMPTDNEGLVEPDYEYDTSTYPS